MALVGKGLSLTVILAMVLAGCSGGGEELDLQGTDGEFSHQFEGENPDAGTIEGIVLDDEGFPIQNTVVGLVELDAKVLSDEGGSFEFLNVDPGTYTVAAVRVGYDSDAKTVTLEPMGTVRVTLTLAAIPIEEPRYVVNGPMTGFLDCGFGTPVWTDTCVSSDFLGNTSGGGHKVRFYMDAENWETFVFDIWWEQTSAATGTGMEAFFTYEGGAATHWWCSGDNPSPLLFRYENPDNKLDSICDGFNDRDPAPSLDMQFTILALPGFGSTSTEDPPVRAMFQQRYDAMATVFYGVPGPTDFTAHPDG